ncbi:MAG TPA: prefoldin subunit alpha [archaeon]|nr:prefoldin subunit alpha [archaeon]
MAEQKMTLTGNQLAQLSEQERRKLSEISRRVNSLQSFRNELQAARDALEEVGKNEKGTQILVNLGGGVFIKASIDDASKAISSIAANAFTEKSGKELVKELDRKIGNLNNSLDAVAGEQQKVVMRLNQLEQIMEAGMREIRKARDGQK